MKVVSQVSELQGLLGYGVVAIGVFDGVHLGHRRVICEVVDRARSRAGAAVVLSFTPHPQKIIHPDSAPPLLQTFEQQAEILAGLGVDYLCRLQFTRSLSLLTPGEFVTDVLAPAGFREVHVGENFRFGRGRAGDFVQLEKLGREAGFTTHPAPVVELRGSRVSSTRIRRLLQRGQVKEVRLLLGRPYQIRGTVVRGACKGSTMGFATANLKAENELIPQTGVYLSRVRVNGREYAGATNIGFRPTVHAYTEPEPTVETHLLGFTGDLYGSSMQLDFCYRLRQERRFENLDALIARVRKDILCTVRYARRVGFGSKTREEERGPR